VVVKKIYCEITSQIHFVARLENQSDTITLNSRNFSSKRLQIGRRICKKNSRIHGTVKHRRKLEYFELEKLSYTAGRR